jgi:hypothetical protein
MLNCFHSEPVAAIYKRCPSLGLLHKVAEEVRFIWIVQTLNTTLRDDAVVIGLVTIGLEIFRERHQNLNLLPL